MSIIITPSSLTCLPQATYLPYLYKHGAPHPSPSSTCRAPQEKKTWHQTTSCPSIRPRNASMLTLHSHHIHRLAYSITSRPVLSSPNQTRNTPPSKNDDEEENDVQQQKFSFQQIMGCKNLAYTNPGGGGGGSIPTTTTIIPTTTPTLQSIITPTIPSPSSSPPPSTSNNPKTNTNTTRPQHYQIGLGVGLGIGFMFIFSLVVVGCFAWRRRRRQEHQQEQERRRGRNRRIKGRKNEKRRINY